VSFRSILTAPIAAFQRAQIRRKFEKGLYRLEALEVCLCEGAEFERVADGDRYGIPVGVNLCDSCGLCFLSPRPTVEALRLFYEADYRKLYRNSTEIDDAYFQRSIRRGQRIFGFLINHGLELKNRVVIEVGCGPGGILKVFQEEGNEVYGCELDKTCVEYSKNQGISCLLGSLEALVDAGVTADLIILSHLLEHISNPFDFVAALNGILRDGGKVYVEVPGLRNVNVNFFKSLQVAHLYYYDLMTLKFVMGKAGYECIEGDETIRSVFGRSDGEVFADLSDNFQRNRAVIKSWSRVH
jgi:SAM-dependent methyltransferase